MDLKNTESNITVTHKSFFHNLTVTIYSTIITLRPTHGYGTTTIQEKTDNEETETSTSPKKYSMTDYFKCRYHLTLFRMGLQKNCFKYQSFPYENHRECYKSSYEERDPCYLHLQIFFLYIHSPSLLEKKSCFDCCFPQ